MKQKIIISGFSDNDSGYQNRTTQYMNKISTYKANQYSDRMVLSHNQKSNILESSSAEEANLNQKSQVGKGVKFQNGLRNFKTFCKTINKFKVNHKKSQHFRKAVNKGKVNYLVNLFVQKITRSTNKDIPQSSQFLQQDKKSVLDSQGLTLPMGYQIFQTIINTINFFFIVIISSFGLAFHNKGQPAFIHYLSIVTFIIILLNLCLNFITIKTIKSRRVEQIRQIIFNYLHGSFCIDFISIFILIIDLSVKIQQMKYIRLLLLLHFPQFKINLQKIEHNFVNNYYREQYWGILHLIIFNFLVAHTISIIFLYMATLQPDDNWLIKSHFISSPWYEQYAWAFYWSFTTMLTIGYGDIVVANYKEAVCMAFIGTFSYIIVAYTINSVGNLIDNLREKDLEKKRNLKIFKELVQKNQISRNVQQTVGNFINQTIEIKTKFNYDRQKKLLSQLPNQMKKDILKQCNSKLFKNISIFTFMGQRIIAELANKIEFTIAHPQEVILTPNNYLKLSILKQGKVGYFTLQSKFNRKIQMNFIEIKPQEKSMPLFLNFVSSSKPKYYISSLNYAVIYTLDLEDMQLILRNFQHQNQKYCFYKDKSKHVLNQYQVVTCQTCKTKHTKADCPKLHYIPLQQIVIHKYLKTVQHKMQAKDTFFRMKTTKHCYDWSRDFKILKTDSGNIIENIKMNTLTQMIYQRVLSGFNVKIQNLNSSKTQNKENQKRSIAIMDMSGRNKSNQLSTIYQLTKQVISIKAQQDKSKLPQSIIQQFLGIQCDSLCDFLNYFPQMNPKQMSKKTDSQYISRKKTRQRNLMKSSGDVFRTQHDFI